MKEKQRFMPSTKLLKTWVYNENTNRCLVVKSRGVVAMVSDGREGSSLFKLSGSIRVEPTSGQQCWQPFVSAQHFEGLHGATAVTHHYCTGNWDFQVFWGRVGWGDEWGTNKQISCSLRICCLKGQGSALPLPRITSTEESRRMVYKFWQVDIIIYPLPNRITVLMKSAWQQLSKGLEVFFTSSSL